MPSHQLIRETVAQPVSVGPDRFLHVSIGYGRHTDRQSHDKHCNESLIPRSNIRLRPVNEGVREAVDRLMVHIQAVRYQAEFGQDARSENAARSEEHTSELQSLMRISYAVFCLKKKNTNKITYTQNQSRLTSVKDIQRKDQN